MPNTNTTINMKIYISATYSDYDHKFHYYVDSYDATQYSKERVAIGTQDIEVVVPSLENLMPQYVKGLQSIQDDIRAAAYQKVQEVQEQINRCLALEYVPTQGDINE